MKYYRVKRLYNNFEGLVAGALYTHKEIKAMGEDYYDHAFEIVRIPKKDTMFFMGNRFEKKEKIKWTNI